MTRYRKLYLIQVEEVAADGVDPAGYVATSDELGLVVEAATLDELKRKVADIAPELYDLNIEGSESRADRPAFVLQHALGGAHAEHILP